MKYTIALLNEPNGRLEQLRPGVAAASAMEKGIAVRFASTLQEVVLAAKQWGREIRNPDEDTDAIDDAGDRLCDALDRLKQIELEAEAKPDAPAQPSEVSVWVGP